MQILARDEALRRVHRGLGRRRRHGRQGAHRVRSRGRAARGRAAVGRRERPADVQVELRLAAARRRHRGRPFGEFDARLGGWDLEGEPYTVADGRRVQVVPRPHARRPHQPLGPHLAALRALGLQGRAAATAWATTGRSPTTTSSPTTTGSTSWSGLFGTHEGLPERARRHLPAAAASRAATSCWSRRPATRLGITCIPSRLSILTKPLNGRPACHYCGQCGRGCATHSNFSSPSVLLPPGARRPAASRSSREPWRAR